MSCCVLCSRCHTGCHTSCGMPCRWQSANTSSSNPLCNCIVHFCPAAPGACCQEVTVGCCSQADQPVLGTFGWGPLRHLPCCRRCNQLSMCPIVWQSQLAACRSWHAAAATNMARVYLPCMSASRGQILCVAGTGVVCARRTGIALCSAVTHVQGGPGLCCAVFVAVSCGGWREIHSLDFSHTSGISLFLPCFFLFARRHQGLSSVAVALPVVLPACPPALRLMLEAFCTDSLRLPVCGPSGPYKVLTTAWPMRGVSCTWL